MANTNLGAVSSYAEAREGGYTGTKEEWQRMLAGLPADAEIATQKAQDAATAAGEAAQTLLDAQQIKEDVQGLKDNVKDMHDEVMQQESANKQDKDYNAVAGNVAVFDEEGNSKDSGIGGGELVVHPGVFDDLSVGTAKNLEDIYATPVAATFRHRTTAGDVSISEHGVATFDTIKGSTEVPNQLVSPTNLNKVSGNGTLEVTDAAGGEAKALELRGTALVKNQLVQNGDFSDGTTGYYPGTGSTLTAVDGVATYSVPAGIGPYIYVSRSLTDFNASHKYLVSVDIYTNDSVTSTGAINAIYPASGYSGEAQNIDDTFMGTWHKYSCVFSGVSGYLNRIAIARITQELSSSFTAQLRNVMCVDLTQLFNGDTTKINAVQTWEDLVAIMPEYGQYVAYNTGEVVGSDAHWNCSFYRGASTDTVNTRLDVSGRVDNHSHFRTTTFMAVQPGQHITAFYPTGTATANGMPATCFYNADKQYVRGVAHTDVRNQPHTAEYTVPEGCYYMRDGFKSGDQGSYRIGLSNMQDMHPTAPLFAAGTAYDSEDVVTGKRTQRIKTLNLGTLNWAMWENGTAHYFYCNANTPADMKKNVLNDLLTTRYPNAWVNSWSSMGDKTICRNNTNIYIRDDSFADKASFVASITGLILYYELATPVVTDITPTPVTQQKGTNTFIQTSGEIRQSPLKLDYDGTDYSVLLDGCRRYITRIDGVETYVDKYGTNYSYVQVRGGRDQVIDLTHWYGYKCEPSSIKAFYVEHPELEGKDIPYSEGNIVNFNGVSVISRFFNAYNHVTGTAELLGGNQYQICGAYTSVSYETIRGTAETLDIDVDGIFTPAEDGVLTVEDGNDTDTCVHLTWSGYRNYGTDGYRWELYGQSICQLPINEYAQDGLMGFKAGCDELHPGGITKRYDVHVFTGTESFTIYGSWGAGYRTTIADMTRGFCMQGACNDYNVLYNTHNVNGMNLNYVKGRYVVLGESSAKDNNILFVGVRDEFPTVTDWVNYLQSRYAAGNPIVVVYPLATPIITPINPPLNLSYIADDFGTEELLPRNTPENIVTTRMNALIRYNLDFTRLGIHVSEIWNYLEDLAKNNADYARAFGYYKQMTVGLAENLIDIHASGEDRTFQLDSSCGETSISDDGSASVKVIQGSTVLWNQKCTGLHDITGATRTQYGDIVLIDAKAAANMFTLKSVPLLVNHIQLVVLDFISFDKDFTMNAVPTVSSTIYSNENAAGTIPRGRWAKIIKCFKAGPSTSYILGWNVSAKTRYAFRNIQVYDLTLMFGFDREPKTYEEFLRRFPDPVYPAEVSRTVNFNGESIATVGFNQCDPDVTHIRVLPRAYQITGPGTLNFYDTELPSSPVAVTYGSTVEPFGFYKNGTKWYRALLGIADYDNTKTYRVNDGVVYESQWYKCNTQIDAAEEFDASKWDAVTLDDALADNFLFTPLFIEPDANGIFTPPTRGWLYYEGNTTETCIHFTWSGYRNGEHEDYWREERELPIERYFPDGMRGRSAQNGKILLADELYSDKAVQKFGVYTFKDTEAWSKPGGTPLAGVWQRNVFAGSYASAQANLGFIDGLSSHTNYDNAFGAAAGNNLVCAIFHSGGGLWARVRVDSCDTLEKIQAFMAGRKLYYPLATPIVTPIDPPLNLTYKVADFGTEQFVPVADSTMPSTPFSGTVRYSTDFTRELRHIVDENVRERVDNLETTVSQKADKDGVYNQFTAGNAYNLIDRHAEGTDRQIGYDTSCGTASISDDGSAEIQELRGTTIQLQNLVADEYQNVFQLGDGYIELPHAYGGEVQPVIYGRTYIPNQQVPNEGEQQDIPLWNDHYYYTNIDGVENIVTGLSALTVTPGMDKVTDLTQMFCPGYEPSTIEEMRRLYPSAGTGAYNPGEVVGMKHSVWTTPVFNQLVLNGDFSDGKTNWGCYGAFSVSDNVAECTITVESTVNNIHTSSSSPQFEVQAGHSVLITFNLYIPKAARTTVALLPYGGSESQITYSSTTEDIPANAWTMVSHLVQANDTSNYLCIYPSNPYWRFEIGDVYKVRDVQLVDLTLMFGEGHEPVTKEEALEKLAQLGKDMAEYHAYDSTGTPIGGTIDMSDIDVEMHGFVRVDPTIPHTGVGPADKFDTACNLLVRNLTKYTLTGSETVWTKVTDAAYPNGYYYRFDTNNWGQITAPGNNNYPRLICANPAFHVSKQGGANQREHSISVAAQRYICVCSSETLDEIKAELAGTTIVYNKVTPSQSTLAYAKPLPTIPTGIGYLRQVSGQLPVTYLTIWYDATEYDMRLVYNKYYWFQHNGESSILHYTGYNTFLHVIAGQDQLAQLECLTGLTSAMSVTSIEELFKLYPYLKTLPHLPYGGPIVNFKGTGIKTVGFNLLNITAEKGDLTGWATTNVPRKFEEGKFYVGFKSDNTINTAYAQFVSTSASQVNFKSRSYYGLLYPMRCFPNTQYQFTGTRSATNNIRNRIVFYDIDGAWISAIEYNANANDSALFTTPENAYWMCLLLATSDGNLNTTRYEANPCVHLTWSGYRNGDYETYWEETRDLPVSERFPEGMNGMDAVRDTIKSAGTVQNYNTYVFTGGETVTQSSYGLLPVFYVTLSAMLGSTSAVRLDDTGKAAGTSYMYVQSAVPQIVTNGTSLYIQTPGVRTVAQMKEWLKGRKLVYRRANPDPIPFDEPVNLTYKVADFGTEQMVPSNPTDAMPTSTALNAIVRYNSDMARTITKLPEDYISKKSLADLNTQIGPAIGGVITAVWDASEQKYVYTYTRTPTVVTLAAGTNAHTLQPNMSYIHAPTTSGVTYTLAVPTDTEVDNEIRLDVTQPTQGSLVFKQGTTTLALQKTVAPAAGSKWRYLCLWQFGSWKVYPISVQ